MKAAVYTKYGPPSVIQFKELPTPVPKENQVLVKIHAASVAAGDWRMRRAEPFAARLFNGLFSPRKINILGFELAGKIESVGRRVTNYKAGDKIFAACGLRFGAHAEYTCLPVQTKPSKGTEITLVPCNLSFEEAAAVPIGATTALRFLRKGQVQDKRRVLIYGASGSVGSYAVQLAKYYGAFVSAVCSTSHIDMVRSLGADEVIDYTQKSVSELRRQFELIFDAVGKLPKQSVRQLIAPQGRYLSVMTSAKGLIGDLELLKKLVESGHIRPVIDRVYPFEEIREAHQYVEQGHKTGNVIIKIQ